MDSCAYLGPAPVPLHEYITSVEAQSVRIESPQRDKLEHCLAGLSVDPRLFDKLGPAVNSGAGLFLYGEPGNGKTTLAERIARCFGQAVWLPYAADRGRANHQALRRGLSPTDQPGRYGRAEIKRLRSPVGTHSPADGRRRRRVDNGAVGDPASRNQELQRALFSSRATAVSF